jgi:hypothetical protein
MTADLRPTLRAAIAEADTLEARLAREIAHREACEAELDRISDGRWRPRDHTSTTARRLSTRLANLLRQGATPPASITAPTPPPSASPSRQPDTAPQITTRPSAPAQPPPPATQLTPGQRARQAAIRQAVTAGHRTINAITSAVSYSQSLTKADVARMVHMGELIITHTDRIGTRGRPANHYGLPAA